MPKLEEELYQWEDKFKKCQSVDNLKKRLNNLMGEYTWSSVIEAEKSLENLDKEKRALLKSKEKTEEKLEESKTEQANLTDKFDQIKAAMDELKIEIDSKTAERNVLDPEYKRITATIKQVQLDRKKHLMNIERKNTEKHALKLKLDEEKQKTHGNYQGKCVCALRPIGEWLQLFVLCL